jgi:hypothetical protein
VLVRTTSDDRSLPLKWQPNCGRFHTANTFFYIVGGISIFCSLSDLSIPARIHHGLMALGAAFSHIAARLRNES